MPPGAAAVAGHVYSLRAAECDPLQRQHQRLRQGQPVAHCLGDPVLHAQQQGMLRDRFFAGKTSGNMWRI